KVSRVHAQVEVDDDRVVISDLDSDTGTFVNGQRVTSHELRHGDIVQVGDTQLCFQSVDEGRPKSGDVAIPPAVKKEPFAPAEASKPKPPTAAVPAAQPAALTKDLPALIGATLARYQLNKVA